jgi:peptidyl-tRNA hydrolase, PTH1 family
VKLIAGLGNPGAAYARTRHNIGFIAADRIARETGTALNEAKFQAVIGHGRWCGHEIIIAKPQCFMNRSGESLREIADFFAIAAENILVMHDDIDFPLGSLKIKVRGGSAGHRGISSIIDQLHTDAFMRLRIGIGRPTHALHGAEYVLDPFSPAELKQVEVIVGTAFQCVETILCQGIASAMNRFHQTTQQNEKSDKPSSDGEY